MSNINNYPYNVPITPLLFQPPIRPNKANNRENNQWFNNNYTDTNNTYKKYPRGDIPAKLQVNEPITTVHRRSYDHVSSSIITINSQDRSLVPRTVPKYSYNLSSDALSFTSGLYDMTVTLPDHGLIQDSYVMISGVSTAEKILNQPFETRAGSNFVRIEIIASHNLTDDYRLLDNLFIKIDNVTSSVGSFPANLINGIHKLYLTCNYSNFPSDVNGNIDTVSLNTNSRYIYIQLSSEATSYYSDRRSPANSPYNNNVSLTFQFIAGIPLYYMNNGYPRSLSSYDPYLQIRNVIDANNFTIRMRQKALETITAGGDSMQLYSLLMADPPYLNPSRYTINLPKEIKNILQVELVGTSIPYSGYLVHNNNDNKNDSVYWQLLDDATGTMYSASILRGNYSGTSLASSLQIAMNNIMNNAYGDVYNFIVSADISTNTIEFSLYDIRKIQNALMAEYIPPDVNTTYGTTYLYIIDPENSVTVGDSITISQTNNLTPIPSAAISGKLIVLSTSVFAEMDAIAMSALTPISTQQLIADRKSRLIEAMISLGYSVTANSITLSSGVLYKKVTLAPDFYQIKLDIYAPLTPFPSTLLTILPLNQTVTTVSSPSQFRMDFTAIDTLGPIMGFRNSGNLNSFTEYRTIIKNTDLYDYEIKLGIDPMIGKQTAFNFKGHSHLFICCPQLSNFDSTAASIGSNASGSSASGSRGVANIFAKIHLDGHQGCTLYDTYVAAPKTYDTPLTSLSSLDILFVTPDGQEYDFNGIDHSLTLQVTYVSSMPEDVNFNANTGKVSSNSRY
jgi:hypothetical protein